QGVSTEADVVRIEASPNGLSVIENYFVKNASSPPVTQFGMHAYEIYLPKDAKIVSSAALGPGSMPVQSAPVPLGPPGNYSFVFPLRPGETRFQVSYRLPYSGSFQFEPRFAAPVDNFAVILPKGMQFTGVPTAAFQSIDEDVKVQTYLTKNVTPQTKLAFHVSGTGLLPKETPVGSNDQNGGANSSVGASGMNPEQAAQSAAENNTRPGIGLGVPIDTPDPLHKYQWWIVSLVAVLLAVGTGVSMRHRSPVPNPATVPSGATVAGGASPQNARPVDSPAVSPIAPAIRNVGENSQPGLLEALKEELFVLEKDRLEGRLSSEEYDRQKAALEIVLKRALLRGATSGTGESA
ncbi:MAG: carboxypeptidase regulatory-like domain-containing protein, partial [Acidobacteriaceae bacterium]